MTDRTLAEPWAAHIPAEKAEWVRRACVADTDECIEWPWGRNSYGYGRMGAGGRYRITHLVLEGSGRPQPPPPRNYALHSCDNPPCCNPRHLKWGTQHQNVKEVFHRGDFGPARLSVDQVQEIRDCGGETGTSLADRFGVSRQTISRIRLGKAWNHVG